MTEPTPSARRAIILSALLATLLVLLCGGLGAWVLSDESLRVGFILPRVANVIDEAYAGQVNWKAAIESAQTAMFSQLDRYSEYLEPKDFDDLSEEMSGAYFGIGVSVIAHDSGLLVMSIREGGPAAQAGFMTGDVIIKIDTIAVAGRNTQHSSDLLRGPEGSKAKVTVIRGATHDTLTLEPTRSRISFQHVSFAGYTPDSILYIRLLDFDAGASDDVASALDSLLNKPGMRPKGVILDLKENPGGLFEEAYETSSLFLDKGKFIVGTSSRSRWNEEKRYSEGEDVTQGLPLVVLVDRGSASAAEIVAGSLKQLGRAKLVGDTTFGKGLVQGYDRFPDGSGAKLTISRYFLEGNLYLNNFDSSFSDTGKGLVPNYYLEFPENTPFVATLESSLILMQFAQLHQDDIVAGPPPLGPDSTWAEQLAIYATQQKFAYSSLETEEVEFLLLTARAEKASSATIAGIEELLRISRKDDYNEFYNYRDYITMRLRELAIERKYGAYRSYADVIVGSRADIRFAEEIILGEQP